MLFLLYQTKVSLEIVSRKLVDFSPSCSSFFSFHNQFQLPFSFEIIILSALQVKHMGLILKTKIKLKYTILH